MHPWFVWLYWIDPLSYGFEALMANEFQGSIVPCVFSNLVPNYLPQYQDSTHQACAGIPGAAPGATQVTGEEYLASLSYSPSNIWRNVGILFAWWILYVGMTIAFTLRWNDAAGAGGTLLIPRENQKKVTQLLAPADEEAQISEKEPRIKNAPGSSDSEGQNEKSLVRNTSIFTWRNLSYVVKTPTGDRTLLDKVHGYCKPGMLGALMGASGKWSAYRFTRKLVLTSYYRSWQNNTSRRIGSTEDGRNHSR
jgi:hypothetical protein